ncbi:Ribosomal RNA small subunit methyltransferase G [Fuerstiella marisgermanici]|uniref:Ribosomal RNA small subunit methyltransferase G n=1 Tax=Fuerstiella marisgermanici TaxID=1891926 RepID=A0A1P8WGD8_9PLAN|nr:Ribosomal RNA small subunit methyltransferase G [Fuerstiella marisgermanici]
MNSIVPDSSTTAAIELLNKSLHRHKVGLADEHAAKLAEYCDLLWEWNAQLNLTRHTDFEQFVTRDLIDSLRLASHIPEEQSVLDVGAGGGVPGVVLAITRPDLNVSMAESVGKKAKALKDICRKLRLSVPVHAARAEDVLKKHHYDVLTLRAVAPLRKILFWFQRHTTAFGSILAIKGPRWVAERDEADKEGLLAGVDLDVIDEYPTPGHDNNSVILSIRYQRPVA